MAKVDAKDKPVGADGSDETFERREIRERFECGNYAVDLCIIVLKVGEETRGGLVAEAGIDPEVYAGIEELRGTWPNPAARHVADRRSRRGRRRRSC